jgi:hypothetical protein
LFCLHLQTWSNRAAYALQRGMRSWGRRVKSTIYSALTLYWTRWKWLLPIPWKSFAHLNW